MEKNLPQNIEVERSILGCIVLDPEVLGEICDTLHAEDFYRDAHRTIYTAMLSLYEQHIPPDFVMLCDELERHEQLEKIGDASYIAGLLNEEATSANVSYYAEIVARLALCRRLIHAAAQIAALGYEQTPNALELSEQTLYRLHKRATTSGFISMQDLMLDYMDHLDHLHQDRHAITGVPTGYTELDELSNGLQKTDLVILAGRPGTGKTSLGLNIGYNAALKGKKIAVYSLEMGKRQLAWRMMAMDSGVEMQRLGNGWIADEEWDAIVGAGGKLSQLPIWINDASGNPVASMRSQLRKLMHQQKIDLVIVDYLQLIESSEDSSKRHENRVQEISEISRGLKAMAKEFEVPVLALAQLSRKVEERAVKIPQLSDLKESGSIEENADMVLFIYRDDYYAEQEQRDSKRPNIADVFIAKHRNGPTGSFGLYFKKDQTKFYNLNQREQ